MLNLNLYYFFIAFFLGLFIIYVTSPLPKVIIKYPTLENANNTTYIDNNNVCYKYSPKEIKCPSKKSS